MDSRCARWPAVLAVWVTLQACASDPATRTPAIIKVLTPETRAVLLDPVVRVSSRLISAARRSELGAHVRDWCWVIVVSEEDTVSRSFVRSNGEIIVSTGTFPFAQSEAGLAAVLSHELAHALLHDPPAVSPARPTDCLCNRFPERPFPQSCPSTASGRPPSLFTHREELQADEMGLKLMAEAGYDPRELLRLWGRMKPQDNGAADEVLVHLTYDRRTEQIVQWLPDALTRYERAHRAPQKPLPSK